MIRALAVASLAVTLFAGCGGDKEAECRAAWEQQVKTTNLTETMAGHQYVVEACEGLPPETIKRISDAAKAQSTSPIWNPDAER